MQKIIGDVTWFVGDGEGKYYKDAGATAVVESGKLVASRNAALKAAWDNNLICSMMDDDVKSIKQAYFNPENKKNEAKPITFDQAVIILKHSLLAETRGMFYFAGCAPTANTYFYHQEKPISFKNFINASLMLMRPGCDVWFDANMTLKDDYDYTLQHIAKYGGVVRHNDILLDVSHYSNKGGAVEYRTSELEQKNIAYLKKKWGRTIRDNPRRPNEILLNVR